MLKKKASVGDNMIIEEIDASVGKIGHDKVSEKHINQVHENYDGKLESEIKYNLDDCVLVRTTRHFPFNRIVETPINAYAECKSVPSGLKEALDNIYKDLPYEERKEKLKIFEAKQRVLRSSVHFCINGLVGSHGYGNFSGRPFIIIEPLKYHVDSIDTLRVEDTFFTNDIQLSNEAVIIIRSDYYEKIKNDEFYKEELNNYKIYLYKGNNEGLAIETVLNRLGYDSFVMNAHGYIDGPIEGTPAYGMRKFIYGYAEQNGINVDKHFYSDRNFEEHNMMEKESTEISLRIVDEISKTLELDENTIASIKRVVSYPSRKDDYGLSLLVGVINNYGLDNLAILIERINQEFDQKKTEEKSSKIL